ncbi:septal ring lytic transglycosylase RlpA family protein [Glaciecola petra]|uniref:Endolytic peptidoglycan transglycosylase RlpA n=1 Tax=Glaciecola petra TaxID=3075602 RepID=A0ABU2ZR53_9ALTE|nr:septal ring lytic transglycosylase RlpA family protein [Aestuariibacter sp. P117]MDT0594518.1 septal ring lytic transglycosylase RlpA family protein [Aestuariibacter sp. P117]
MLSAKKTSMVALFKATMILCMRNQNIIKKLTKVYILVLTYVVIAACATSTNNVNNSRYKMKQDIAPNFDYGEITYSEVIPAYEPYNVWTSRPYKVLGAYYTPLQSGKGHEETGNASWYGQKFHGHKTANGEVFDMFALTAAHKTLPLPSFVRVTNLTNKKSVIVRVNDRGPFHDDRVLDLSYGAAKKLGYHKQGVAKIKLEVIHINEVGDVTIGNGPTQYAKDSNIMVAQGAVIDKKTTDESTSIANSQLDSGLFVQVMALQSSEKAKSLATGLSNLLQVNTQLPLVDNIYKLQLGPLKNEQKAKKIIEELKKIGFDEAFAVHFEAD